MTSAAGDAGVDHQLMVAVSRGNLNCMSEIYQNRHRPLFRFFFRLTGRQASSEDLVHETFLRMIRYRHTYEGNAGFDAWMYRIARNVLTDSSRKLRPEVTSDEAQMEAVAGSWPSALDTMVKEQDLALLRRAMRALPDDKRELLVLSRFQGLSYEQIGRIVGCEAGTVKVRVFRAMKAMGQIFCRLHEEKAS